jgi:hypothetical protein
MTYKITDIHGISPEFATRLNALGLHTTDDFLHKVNTEPGMRVVMEKLSVGEPIVRGWRSQARFLRLKSMRPQDAELLVGVGLENFDMLRQQKPEDLVRRMTELNATRKLGDEVPGVDRVKAWLEEAKVPDVSPRH